MNTALFTTSRLRTAGKLAAIAATYYKYPFCIRVDRHRHMCDHLIIYKLICVRKNNLAIQRNHFAKLI